MHYFSQSLIEMCRGGGGGGWNVTPSNTFTCMGARGYLEVISLNKKWQLQVATLYHVYQRLFGDMAGTGKCNNREPVFPIS